MALSSKAAKWRAAKDEEHILASRDPTLLSDAVVQVVQSAQINELGLNDRLNDQSFRSFRPEVEAKPAEQDSWGFTPEERRESLERLRQGAEQASASMPKIPAITPAAVVPDLPGVPADWTAGVYKLRSMPEPCGIDAFRWDRYRYDCLRLLHERGVELHAAGWDALDLFGLNAVAPDRRPDGMGVAWVCRKCVLGEVTAETMVLHTEDGSTQRATKMGKQAKLEAVVAWELLS